MDCSKSEREREEYNLLSPSRGKEKIREQPYYSVILLNLIYLDKLLAIPVPYLYKH